MDNQPKQALVPATNDADTIRVLGQSLYPGARPESIRMVLAWCRATGQDPMKKPIHIVPMEVKDAATGKKEWRDILMPGIGTYRTDAANSGAYGGIDEPEFGPDVTDQIDAMTVTYPTWCRVTVYRLVGNEKRAFTAKEYWVENYAAGYQGKGVNSMWRKRPYGQLAKCAEAQALRKAFPDETGQTNTTDELEGKTFAGETIDGRIEDGPRTETKQHEQHKDRSDLRRAIKEDEGEERVEQQRAEQDQAERISAFMVDVDKNLRATKNGTQALKVFTRALETATTLDDLADLEGHQFRQTVRNWTPMAKDMVDDAIKVASARLAPKQELPPTDEQNPSQAMWDPPTDDNGVTHELAGEGTNNTAANGAAIQDQVGHVAKSLTADKPDEGESEWMPGDT